MKGSQIATFLLIVGAVFIIYLGIFDKISFITSLFDILLICLAIAIINGEFNTVNPRSIVCFSPSESVLNICPILESADKDIKISTGNLNHELWDNENGV